jgi:oxygen-independent coproporphyrinogen-3 oxidase
MKLQELAIYIHFPYCELKCPYCDFNSHVSKDLREKDLISCYKKELDFFLEKLGEKRILRSIFFGGGTPSLMKPENVQEVIEYIKGHEALEVSNPEITLEANPSSAEYQKFLQFKNAGVSRLSIGIQSLNPANLKFLGRKHNEVEAKNALFMAKEIFNEFSFDLIYCLPNQTLKEWESELNFAIENFAKNHLSAYTLTIEKGTPFFKMHQNKDFLLPQNEDEFYFLTNNILTEHGFSRYEISNYAKNGAISKHNTAYWKSIDYLGIGPGAHGRITINKERFQTYNFAIPEKYISAFETERHAMQNYTKLSKEDLIKEILLMNLRAFEGIDIADISKRFSINLLEELNLSHLDAMQNANLLHFNDSEIKLSEAGLNVANAIISKLYD